MTSWNGRDLKGDSHAESAAMTITKAIATTARSRLLDIVAWMHTLPMWLPGLVFRDPFMAYFSPF